MGIRRLFESDETATSTDANGLYVCRVCQQANLIPVLPNQDGTVKHLGMHRHRWTPDEVSEQESADG